MIFDALPFTDFKGRTGTVRFQGNDRRQGVVDIFQFDDAGDTRFIGFYNSTNQVYIYASQLEFQTPYIPISST
jgi:hypothetical protein